MFDMTKFYDRSWLILPSPSPELPLPRPIPPLGGGGLDPTLCNTLMLNTQNALKNETSITRNKNFFMKI